MPLRPLFIVCAVIGIGAFISMGFMRELLGFYVAFACLFGLGSASVGVQVSMLVSQFFGQKDYGAIYSKVHMAQSLSGMVAVVAMGAAVQALDSYLPIIITLTIIFAVNVLSLFVARGSAKKLWKSEGLEAPKL